MRHIYRIQMTATEWDSLGRKEYTVDNVCENVFNTFEEAKSRMYEIVGKKINKNNYRALSHSNTHIDIWKYGYMHNWQLRKHYKIVTLRLK